MTMIVMMTMVVMVMMMMVAIGHVKIKTRPLSSFLNRHTRWAVRTAPHICDRLVFASPHIGGHVWVWQTVRVESHGAKIIHNDKCCRKGVASQIR